MKLSSLAINAEAAIEGEWIKGLDGMGDLEIKMSSLDAPAAENYFGKLLKQLLGSRVRRKDKSIPPAVRDYVTVRTLIEKCIHDMRNLQGDDGAPLPFSKDYVAGFLLKDAPEGIAGPGGQTIRTPDGKAFNFEAQPLYNLLLEANATVGAIDAEAEADEKNAVAPGSAGFAD